MDTGEISGHVGETQHLSELRIVLLGSEDSGKSTAGNTILGKQVFTPGKKTVACTKGQAEVAGRQVTVVDTPGWVRYFPVDNSPELLKDQVAHSLSLCPPGPHAVLLVINLGSSFQEEDRRATQEHLELLSDTVWRHTILLFRFEDNSREMTIHKPSLQWLIEKCGNRYHILDKNSSGVSQVPQLLEMIEKMVEGNGGSHFHMEEKVLQDMEEKRIITEERANQRAQHVMKHRETLRDLLNGGIILPSELKLVLLGWVAAGKSSTGNTILGREEFGVWRRASQCEKKQGEVAGRQVTVVLTPGWWKFMPAELTPDWIKQEVVKSLTLCHPGPHAILLVIPADTSFKEEQRKIIRDNMRHLGEGVWGHTLVLFTWGEYLGENTIEEHIEREGQALQWLIEKCGNRYHVLNNMKKGDHTQVTELLEKIEEMVAGRSVFCLETQSKVMEAIEEADAGEIRSADLSTDKQKITELMKIIDHLWMKREEGLLERLGIGKGTDNERETQQCSRRGRCLNPADFQKEEKEEQKESTDSKTQAIEGRSMEKERHRKRSYSESQTQTTRSKRIHGAEERNAWLVQDTDVGPHIVPWSTTEEYLNFLHNQMRGIFEKEWNRKQDIINQKVRTEVKSYITPAAKESSMDVPYTYLKGSISSEPDTTDVAMSCKKVHDWLEEEVSGNSAATSEHKCSSEQHRDV